METTDLEKIPLLYLDFYNSYRKFYSTFRKYNIVNVAQVLDDNLMNSVKEHFRSNALYELEGFISLVKYKYLGIIPDSVKRLDEPLITGNNHILNFNELKFGFFHYSRLNTIAEHYINCKMIDSDITIIDFFTFILRYSNSKIIHNESRIVVKLYVEMYDRYKLMKTNVEVESKLENYDYNIANETKKLIGELNKQLQDAIDKRNDLDNKIIYLSSIIGELQDGLDRRGNSK